VLRAAARNQRDGYLQYPAIHMFVNELNAEDGYNDPYNSGNINMYSRIATSDSLRAACFVLLLHQLQVSVSSAVVVT
jgi:hypothetical protein